LIITKRKFQMLYYLLGTIIIFFIIAYTLSVYDIGSKEDKALAKDIHIMISLYLNRIIHKPEMKTISTQT